MNEKAKTARMIQVLGIVIFAVGAILARIGTTSMALFIFYIAIVFAGLGVVWIGQKKYNETLGGR